MATMHLLARAGLVAAAAALVAWGGIAAFERAGSESEPRPTWEQRAAGPGIVPFPQVGSRARDFTLPVLHDDAPYMGADSVTLSDLQGRWVYLDVFGTWCGPCQEKYPDMEGIVRDVEAAGGIVIGLLLHDRPQGAAKWFRDQGGMAYPFLVLDDETARRWRIVGAPMGFLISPSGHVARRCVGCAMDGDRIEDLAAEIAALSG